MSYVVIEYKGDKKFYWQYGAIGGWTEDLKQARLYEREASANQARAKLFQRPGYSGLDLRVEYTKLR